MKNLASTLTIIMFLQAVSFGTINYVAPFTKDVPVIDGDITSGWQNAMTFNMTYPDITTSPNEGTLVHNEPNSLDSAADLSADVYLMWDFDNLYIAARVYDDSLNFRLTGGGAMNAQDIFQFCFNVLNDPNATIFVNAPIYDLAVQDVNGDGPFLFKHEGSGYTLPNAELGGQVLGDGYVLELKVPWSDFDYAVKPGDIHGIGFLLVDYEGTSASVDTLMFDYAQGNSGNLANIDYWNTLTLVGENDCGLWGIVPADLNMDCSVNLSDLDIIVSGWLECTNPNDSNCMSLL